jgi:predicted DsbA family dithiol-disulfide isomerase
VNWRYFPLEQVNTAEGPDWKLWEQPPNHRSRGRAAFHAAIAARNQGEEAFERFHHALLKSKHEDGNDHGRPATLTAAAEEAGLDLARFQADLDDRLLLARIGEDYEHGREEHGVFGTPTFVFPNGGAAYLKMLPAAGPDEALPIFEEFVRTVRDRPFISEFKRPKKPERPA